MRPRSAFLDDQKDPLADVAVNQMRMLRNNYADDGPKWHRAILAATVSLDLP